MAAYFEEFANLIQAPIQCGVEVTNALRRDGHSGFEIQSTAGNFLTDRIVVATGPFQVPLIPPVIPESADFHQMHSANYQNPRVLPDGAVLVIGAGSSGAQIAEDLLNANRSVFLSVGPHHRPPRRYRGRDYCWWLGVLRQWDMAAPKPGTGHITISVSGTNGGRTIDFRTIAQSGAHLLGMTTDYQDGNLYFADDLANNIAIGDADYLALLDAADQYVEANGLGLPEEPTARDFLPDPETVTNPTRLLNLRDADIRTIIWATGYTMDFKWMQMDAFDERGQPKHQRGVSTVPNVYFLGLPWLSRRGSSFIWGVWHDARYLAEQIQIQRNYTSQY